jgi:hypothetical protein
MTRHEHDMTRRYTTWHDIITTRLNEPEYRFSCGTAMFLCQLLVGISSHLRKISYVPPGSTLGQILDWVPLVALAGVCFSFPLGIQVIGYNLQGAPEIVWKVSSQKTIHRTLLAFLPIRKLREGFVCKLHFRFYSLFQMKDKFVRAFATV